MLQISYKDVEKQKIHKKGAYKKGRIKKWQQKTKEDKKRGKKSTKTCGKNKEAPKNVKKCD